MQAKGQSQGSTGTTLSKFKELLVTSAPVVQYTQTVQALAFAPVATVHRFNVIPSLRILLQCNVVLPENYHELTDTSKDVFLMSDVMSNTQLKAFESPMVKFLKGVFTQDAIEKTHESVWGAMNFITVAAVTCVSIVAVQSPVKSMLLNLVDKNTLLPTYSGGSIGLIKALYRVKDLYRGTQKMAKGSLLRTTYVTGAKEGKPSEETPINKLRYVAYITFGEVAVTQISDSLSQLEKKPEPIPKDFNWKTPHNAYQLMTGGFTPRYLSGLINFGCLCLLSETYASKLTIHFAINDPVLANSLGGLGSGVTAAIISYPFSAFRDYTLLQAKVEDGKLMTKRSSEVLKSWVQVLQKNPKSVGAQLIIKMGLTGLIFAIVSGVGEYLGKEPLKAVVPELEPKRAISPQRFFSVSPPQDQGVKLPEKAPASVTEAKR